jgi:hypothetical protein
MVKLLPHDMAKLTCNRLVYFSNKDGDLPIVIDTGGSLSVSPIREEFVGEICPADTLDLQGLSSVAAIDGVRTVQWTVKDIFGSTRSILTEAYYVPLAAIHLFSPQKYFQEQEAGIFWCDACQSVLTLADGSELEFRYNLGSNLPLRLAKSQGIMTWMMLVIWALLLVTPSLSHAFHVMEKEKEINCVTDDDFIPVASSVKK